VHEEAIRWPNDRPEAGTRASELDPDDPEVVARFFHGLSDATRIQILQFLLDGPRTAGEIVRQVDRQQASVSSHLGCLRFCGFVHARRDGRNVVYEIVDNRIREILRMGRRHIAENLDQIVACRVIAPAGGGDLG